MPSCPIRVDLDGRGPLAHQLHGGLAVAHHRGLAIRRRHIGAPRKPFWNGFRSTSSFSSLAGRDEGRVARSRSSAPACCMRLGAADAHGQVGPVELRRPLVLARQGDRGDPGGLELLDGVEELGPGGGRRGDAGLGEQRLVVPEADHAEVERHAVLLPSIWYGSAAPGVERVDPAATSSVMSLTRPASTCCFSTPPPQDWNMSGASPA